MLVLGCLLNLYIIKEIFDLFKFGDNMVVIILNEIKQCDIIEILGVKLCLNVMVLLMQIICSIWLYMCIFYLIINIVLYGNQLLLVLLLY